MDDYDEDLLQNPFFKALSSKGKQLYQNATENRRTICIPRKGTTSRSHYTKDQFESHILRQVTEDGDLYITENNKEVKINRSFIVTVKGFNELKSVQILFEETFFNKNEESYHVLCIDQLLEGTTFSSTAQPVIQNLETFDNCVDFLWSGTSNRKARQQINEIIYLFNSTYTRLMSESIRHTMDATNAVFSKAMQISLKETHVKRPAMANKMFMDNVKVAVETYVMDGVYEKVFKGISSFLSEEDAAFNKTTRNLAELQLKDLNVNVALSKNIPKAKKILAQLNKFKTPLEKFYVLKFTITAMSEASKATKEDTSAITADDLLPALVFLVVKTDIPNWLANLTYLQNFHFSRSKSDEFQFYLSSTEAAIEHVRNGKLDSLITLTHTQRLKMASSLFQTIDSPEKSSRPLAVDIFFENIRARNTEEMLKTLQSSATTLDEINEALCHPLCSCDKCEKMVATKRKNPSAVTVFSRDELGCTGLHQAAEFGSDECMYELIKKGAIANATNYLGSTPLHYACQRGHHKAAVMLTHYGADANVADNAGNSPLHLAVENCHEFVVDYLCSEECERSCGKKLDIDAINEHGDTALHIASRWGFGRLVFLLIKNGALKDIKNKKEMTAEESALNSKVKEIFSEDTGDDGMEKGYIYLPPSPTHQRSYSIDFAADPLVNGIGVVSTDSRTTIKRKTEFVNLLREIANGRTEVVREKLGIPPDTNSSPCCEDETDGMMDLCHPLCQCVKCTKLQKTHVTESVTLSANMSNDDGVTPLHAASLHGYEEIVNLLLNKANADPNLKTRSNHRTPLHLACQYNNIECVSMLLKSGAKTNMKDTGGNTPLHYTCTNGHIGPAILLLQCGADVHICNQRGNTPLHDAARWNFHDLCGLLLHYDAPLTVRNKTNLTPVQYTANDDIQTLLRNAEQRLNENSNETNNITETKKNTALNFSDENDASLFAQQEDDNTEKKMVDRKYNPEMDQQQKRDYDNTTTAETRTTTTTTTITNKNERDVKLRKPLTKQLVKATLDLRRDTVSDLFAALEHENILMLRQISSGVKQFDRRKNLRRTSTIDKSSNWLNTHLKTMLSIQRFDQSSLRSVVGDLDSPDSLSFTMESISDIEPLPDNFDNAVNINGLTAVRESTPHHYNEDLLTSDDHVSNEVPNTPIIETMTSLCNESLPKKHVDHEPQFEEWYENEIDSDSATEEFEHAIDVFVDADIETTSRDQCALECVSDAANERMKELLNDAIHDTDENNLKSEFQTSVDVRRTLSEDNEFLKGMLPTDSS